MTAVTIIQAAALVGAVVGGILARKRRKQLEETNVKLRKINQELRRKNEKAAPDEIATYKTALERSLGAPSAAHPIESYGSLKVSLARARRQVEETIKEAKLLLHNSCKPPAEAATAALPLLAEALQLSKDIKDLRAERAVSKLRAHALRSLGDLSGSLQELQQVLDLTAAVGESGEGDADALGEMGDVLAEMGNFEAAGKYYDLTIEAIQGSNSTSAGSPLA
jgi:tetratricopeptide (TPR) repeat protein